MKSIKILFLFFLINVSAYGQFNMPSFKDVVNTFFSRYSFDNGETYIKFQRKKDGWFVSEEKLDNPGNYLNTKLFWSKDKNIYNELDYPTTTKDTSLISETVYKYYLSLINWGYEEYQFQRNKYYGYPGWDWDVINDDTDKTDLSDSLLESKARAYSNYASGFIAEQYGDVFVNNDTDRVPIQANEKISTSRTEKFLFYEVKAINAFEELLKMNPNYVTKVGNIKIKLANEYLFTYLELLMAGDSITALGLPKKPTIPTVYFH